MAENDSFYGESPNYLLIKCFESKNEANTNFQQGDNYVEVGYGDYFFVEDTGYIYQRSATEIDDGDYCIEAYKLAGPAGPPSKLNFKTMSEIESSEITPTTVTANIDSSNLVPARTFENNEWVYNDDIIWKYYHREPEAGEEGDQVDISFTVPYPEFKFDIEMIGIDKTPEIEDLSETVNGVKTHPFFTHLNLKLPYARRGDSINNLYVINAGVNDGVDYGETDINTVNDIQDRHLPIIVYNQTTYDNEGLETEVTKFLAELKIVDNIDIDQNGYLSFWLPHSNNDENSKITSSFSIVPIFNDITLDDTGNLSFSWSLNGETYTKTINTPPIKWIKNVEYTSDGIKIIWNTTETDGLGNTVNQTSLVTPSNNEKFITDIISYNNDLYKSYTGINADICADANITSIEELASMDTATVNAAVNGTNVYYKGPNNIWYKKIVSITSGS